MTLSEQDTPTRKNGKARIEDAALTLFANHGVDGVTTKQIAKAAELSEGAIYRHFKSKDELARSLMMAIHIDLTKIIRDAAEHPTINMQIEAIVERYCEIADTHWDLFRYHILHLHHFPNLSAETQDNPQTAAADLLHEAMMRGEIPADDSSLLASMSLGIVLQTAQSKVLGFFDVPLSPYSFKFTETILSILKYAPSIANAPELDISESAVLASEFFETQAPDT